MLSRILTIISISIGFSSYAYDKEMSTEALFYTDSIPADSALVIELNPVSELLKTAESFLGVPYKYGSQSSSGFDCSGYVRQCYSALQLDLPHSSSAQSNLGQKVKLKEVQPGDLLFFKGRSTRKKTVGHVAIVHSVDPEGKVYMIHASTSRGVIIECYNDSEYFKKRFVVAKRLV